MTPANADASAPSLVRSLIAGGVGFSLASLAVFATVAFAETWMYGNLGLWGAYAAWTALFVGLGGAALLPLARGLVSPPRFYGIFAAGFFVYALGWISAYFALRKLAGELTAEIAGALVAPALMALVFAFGFGNGRLAARLFVPLLLAHGVGYFAGSILNHQIGGRPGMLTWGGVYGLCLGAGLGATLYLLQAASGRTRPEADA